MKICTFAAIYIGSYEVSVKILRSLEREKSGRSTISAAGSSWEGMHIPREASVMNWWRHSVRRLGGV